MIQERTQIEDEDKGSKYLKDDNKSLHKSKLIDQLLTLHKDVSMVIHGKESLNDSINGNIFGSIVPTLQSDSKSNRGFIKKKDEKETNFFSDDDQEEEEEQQLEVKEVDIEVILGKKVDVEALENDEEENDEGDNNKKSFKNEDVDYEMKGKNVKKSPPKENNFYRKPTTNRQRIPLRNLTKKGLVAVNVLEQISRKQKIDINNVEKEKVLKRSKKKPTRSTQLEVSDDSGKDFDKRLRKSIRIMEKPQHKVSVKLEKAVNKRVNKNARTKYKPYSCDSCNKSFPHPSALLAHSLTHTGEKPFKCEKCSLRFNQKSHLVRHSIRHKKVAKKFVCPTCKKRFLMKDSLEVHLRIHSGEKPYTCEDCRKSFTQKSQLNTHAKIHKTDKIFICSVCNKAFLLLHHLKSHLQYVHMA